MWQLLLLLFLLLLLLMLLKRLLPTAARGPVDCHPAALLTAIQQLTTQLLALLLNLALFFLLLAPPLPRGTTPRRSSRLSKRCPSFGDSIGNRQPLFVNGTQSWL